MKGLDRYITGNYGEDYFTPDNVHSWVQEHKGQTYESLRSEIDRMEWGTFWPVIDQYTRLTGEIHDSNRGREYDIVDIVGRRIYRHELGCEAAIKTK